MISVVVGVSAFMVRRFHKDSFKQNIRLNNANVVPEFIEYNTQREKAKGIWFVGWSSAQ